MRRNLTLAALLVAVAGLVWLASRESVRPRVLAHASGSVSAPVGSAGSVAWIEQGKDARQVFIATRWRKPRVLISDPGLTSVGIDGGRALVAIRGDSASKLLAIDLRSGRRQELAQTRGEIAQVSVGDGVTALVEERPAAVPAAPFIAAAGPVTVIRAMSGKSPSPVVVAALTVDAMSVPATAARERRVELLGPSHGRIWWVKRRGRDASQTTSVRSAPVAGGEVNEAIAEPGAQQAILLGEAVLLTSFSPESAMTRDTQAIRRLPLAGGKPQVVADWLRRSITLMGSGRTAYVQDGELLWRLASTRGGQQVIYERPGGIQDSAVIGDEEYLVLQGRKQLAVAERPLTSWARVRHLLERVAWSEGREPIVKRVRK